MIDTRPRSLLRYLFLPCLAFVIGCDPSEEVEAQGLPPADSLIAAYVRAIGGEEAYTSIESIRTTGTTLIPAMGLQGEFELLQGSPNRMLLTVNVPGLGEIVSGFDGEVGWTVNPLVGPALTSGGELIQTAEQAHILGTLRDPELVPRRMTLEQTEFAGIPCWFVSLTWASGRKTFDCYALETGLLIATEEVQATVMGEIPSLTLFFEYRDVDGRLFPMRVVQQAMGQEQEMRVETVEVNTVDPSAFALPATIQTLQSVEGQ